jgi:hypothetical protein
MNREKLHCYLCLTPIVGVIPSVLALIKKSSSVQVQSAGRLSLMLFLGWAGVYSSTHNSDAVLTELINGTGSSVYFLLSLWLMVKLAQNKFPVPSQRVKPDRSQRH